MPWAVLNDLFHTANLQPAKSKQPQISPQQARPKVRFQQLPNDRTLVNFPLMRDAALNPKPVLQHF